MGQEEVDAANRLILDLISKYRVIIAGCRDFTDYELLKEKCDYYLQNQQPEDIIIVSGHASGADALGEKYAQERGFNWRHIRQTGKSTEGQLDQSEMLRWLAWLMLSYPSGMAKAGAQRT